MILAVDATTLRGRLSGVGYYTARLVDSLADGAGDGEIERLIVLSNRTLPIQPGGRLEVYDRRFFPVRSVWMQCVLPGILAELRPDLVHFTNYLAPAVGDTPYVLSVHDMTLQLLPELHTWRKRLLTAQLLPRTARRAQLLLTPSDSTRRDLVRLLGVDAGRVRVVPYAAAPGFAPAPGDPARLARRYGACHPYFLYVGTLEPRKNLERALRAFARAAPSLPGHRLVLAGQPGWKYEATLRLLERPELRGRVALAGYVPEQDLPALMTNAEAFVYPSLYEGFGLPVVEAMACGAPVLTSRSSSLAEIAEGAALLVDPRDERALADAFVTLAGDASLRARLRQAGLARAATFSWERTGRETVEVYKEALADRRSWAVLGPRPSPDPALAILRTVAYASLFQAPLTIRELHRRLPDVPMDVGRLERWLRSPELRGRLAVTAAQVHPAGREEWIPLKQARRERTRRLLARHQSALDALARLPFVRLVALSGACAHDNATDDDVDVFLVVRRGRAWSVFLAFVLLARLLGVRRTLCVNYVVDEAALAIQEHDFYTASEVVGLRPLAGRAAYRRLVEANPWVVDRFPNFAAAHVVESEGVPETSAAAWLERLLDWGPAQLLEAVSRGLLGAYLRLRDRGRPGVTLSPHRLKLHREDHGPVLAAAFAEALARWEGSAA